MPFLIRVEHDDCYLIEREQNVLLLYLARLLHRRDTTGAIEREVRVTGHDRFQRRLQRRYWQRARKKMAEPISLICPLALLLRL